MAKSKSFAFNGLAKSLKTLSVSLNSMADIGGTFSSSVKIDIGAKNIDNILRFAEKFPDKARIAYKETLMIIANDLSAALDEAMESSVWTWNDETRDIIDTGALRDSARVVVDGDNIEISYSEDYAAIVHFGGYVTSGFNPDIQIYYPARPWVEAVLLGGYPVEQFDFGAEFTEVFISRLGSIILDEG